MTLSVPMTSLPEEILDSFNHGFRDITDSQAYQVQIDDDIEVHVQSESPDRILMLAMLAIDFSELGDDQMHALLALNQPGDAYPLLTVSINAGTGQLMVWTSVESQDKDAERFSGMFDRLVRRARGMCSLLRSGLYGQAANRRQPVNSRRSS